MHAHGGRYARRQGESGLERVGTAMDRVRRDLRGPLCGRAATQGRRCSTAWILCCSGSPLAGLTQEDQVAVAVIAALEFRVSVRGRKTSTRRLLHDDKRVGREPAALARRHERAFGEPLSVRRIKKGDAERLERMHRPEPGRIAPEDARAAAEPERLDVLAFQRTRLRAIINKQNKRSAARGCFTAERSGAGEEIKYARAGD